MTPEEITRELQAEMEARWPDGVMDWSHPIPEDTRAFFERRIIKHSVEEIRSLLADGEGIVVHGSTDWHQGPGIHDFVLGPRDREEP